MSSTDAAASTPKLSSSKALSTTLPHWPRKVTLDGHAQNADALIGWIATPAMLQALLQKLYLLACSDPPLKQIIYVLHPDLPPGAFVARLLAEAGFEVRAPVYNECEEKGKQQIEYFRIGSLSGAMVAVTRPPPTDRSLCIE